MFIQVSKISFAGLFIFVLLFQQLNVGSEANASTLPAYIYFFKDTLPEADTSRTIQEVTIKADTLINDTNINESEALKSPVKYHARDSMRVNITNEIVFLYGDAIVDYEDLHLNADFITIDMNNKELFAEGLNDSLGNVTGSPVFSQGDQKFRSSSIHYNFESRKGKIAYVITQEGQGYIHGEVVKKDPENNFFIKKGQYTTCNLDHPHFAITSNRLKVISNNKIVTGPAYLTIEGVPTPLLLPFGFFPNKAGRSSGILFPSFGESAQRGFYFQRLGYYFGFNDYVNLALTSDVYTKGSYTLNASSLYKKRYRYSGNVRVSYAYTVNSEKDLPDYSVKRDYRINWTHTQDPKFSPNNTFNASVNAGSSDYYANTISSQSNYLTNTFESAISFAHSFPDKPINYTIALKHFQNTITREIRLTSPEISFSVLRINPFKRKLAIGAQKWYEKIGVSYLLNGKNYIDTKDTLLFKKESLDNFQNGLQHSIPVATSFNVLSYLNVSPSFNFIERWYFKTTQYRWNDESQKVDTVTVKKFEAPDEYSVALGLKTTIFGMYQFQSGPIKAIRHVMTPSVSLGIHPDFGQAKYGYYESVQVDTNKRMVRYSIFHNSVYGGPSDGKYANLNFSLDNNLEMKVRSNSDTGTTVKKIKIFESLRFATNYNLLADSMKLDVITMSGRTTILDKVSLTFGSTFDPYSYDANNIDYDQLSVIHGGRLFHVTQANFSTNFSLNQKANKENPKYSAEDLNYINQHPEDYIDFEIPFNLGVSYSMNYTKKGSLPGKIIQSASFNGDVSLTPEWKVRFNSWYDVTNKKFTNFGLDIYRDLHCWEMSMHWIPFGYQESWNFTIKVKASILQDLKLEKRKDYYDN